MERADHGFFQDAQTNAFKGAVAEASPLGGIFHLFTVLLWTPLQYLLTLLMGKKKEKIG